MTNEDQLASFAAQLSAQTGTEKTTPEHWLAAFNRLAREINDRERTVVLLDEISWMGRYDNTFAGTLKIAWDNMFHPHDKLIMVLCGSVSTWIKDEILGSGAFYGRRSLDIVVPELPLRECVKFWGEAAKRIKPSEIFDVLAVTGGVPKYLEEVDPALDAKENLRRMCFLPKSPLREDFDEMFTDVITKQPRYAAKVLRALVDGAKSVSEIAEALGVAKSGNITDSLEQLMESGMVAVDAGKSPVTGEDIRERRYRLRDNYTRFYLKYIEPVTDLIDGGAFAFSGLDTLAGWNSVMGLAFENMVVNHVRDLIKPLHLERTLILSAAPFVKRGSRKSDVKGCQVDLLLQTEGAVMLVEIKRQKEIGVEVIDEMRAKVATFPPMPGRSVRTALIYDGELSPRVEAVGYFDAVVPFTYLLGL